MIVDQIRMFFELCTTGPVLPASVLMLLIVVYGMLVIIGALDFDLFDIDFDIDADADVGGATSFGFMTLRFLNLGDVPIVVWLGIFGLIWWALSLVLLIAFDGSRLEAAGGASTAILVVRNVVLSLFLTKGATQPLTKVFAKQKHHKPEDLIGHECEISTYEATPKSGQARYRTDGAPLLLNVKTRDANIPKGQIALIIDYDPSSKIYLVAPAAEFE